MSLNYCVLIAALIGTDPQPQAMTPTKIKALMAAAAKVECIRHSREPTTFTMLFETPEEIAELAKRFNPVGTARPYPGNSRVVHVWVIRIYGKDRRCEVVQVFGENKLSFGSDDKTWLADLESKGFHRFLTDRATELKSPDPLVPSLDLKELRTDLTVPKIDSMRGHKVLLHASEEEIFVTEDATDALIVYRCSRNFGTFIRSHVFQDARREHEIPQAVVLEGMRGPYDLTQSGDGTQLYVSCQLSDSICVFRHLGANDLPRWKRLQVCSDNRDGVQGLRGPGPLALSPDGNHLYVASLSGSLVCFRRNVEGELTYASRVTGPHESLMKGSEYLNYLKFPTSIVVSPDGRSLYVADFPTHGIVHFDRDPRTGQLTARGYLQDEIKDGHYLIADRGLTMPKSLVIPPDGKNLYLCSVRGTLSTWKRNEATGTLEFVELHKEGQNGVKGLNYAMQVTAVPKTNRICVVGQNSNGFAQFERGSDGRLKFLTSHTCAPEDTYALPSSLAVSSNLRFFYLASARNTLTVLGIVNDPLNDRMDEPK